ncbi:unnamed protein product, partial [Rotaria magnacalcarata]
PIQTAAYYYPNSLNQQILIPTSYIQPWQWNNWNNRPGSEPTDIYQPNQNIGKSMRNIFQPNRENNY